MWFCPLFITKDFPQVTESEPEALAHDSCALNRWNSYSDIKYTTKIQLAITQDLFL